MAKAEPADRILGYRAQQVLALVQNHVAQHRHAPSYRMICDELGIATKAEVCRIVAGLERRGRLIRIGHGRAHRIRIAMR